MSLEQFCLTHPAELDLKETLGNKKSREGRSDRSLIGLLAEDLTKAAGEGMRQLTGRLDPSGVTFNPGADVFQQMAPQTVKAVFQNHAAIIFGVSVVGVEDTLWNGYFDSKGWGDRYNMAMNGTPFPGLDINQGPQELTQEQWLSMVSLANKDKTLTEFFKEGIVTLPGLLRRILHESEQLEQIRSTIIPIFSERARFLVG